MSNYCIIMTVVAMSANVVGEKDKKKKQKKH